MAGISAKALTSGGVKNNYLFNAGTELASKEFADGAGLELYETEFRAYDPQLGRFWQIDPLATTTENWSAYAYVQNNPLLYNDPWGLDTTIHGDIPDGFVPQDGDLRIPTGEEFYGGWWQVYSQDRGWTWQQQENNVVIGPAKPKTNYWSLGLDIFQGVVDIVGFIPLVGEIADGVNRVISLARGNYTDASLSATSMIPFVGWGPGAAKIAKRIAKWSKSSLKLGRRLHRQYKRAEALAGIGIKEFKLPSGKKIDFLDIQNGVIYELKPGNARGFKQGQNQLNQYLEEVQSAEFRSAHPELSHITDWKIQLEFY